MSTSLAFSAVGDTVNLAVTGTAQTIALTTGTNNVMVTNIGTQTVFIRFGNSAVTVTVNNGYPLLANSTQSFSQTIAASNAEATTCAVIAAAVGSTVYISTGEGV